LRDADALHNIHAATLSAPPAVLRSRKAARERLRRSSVSLTAPWCVFDATNPPPALLSALHRVSATTAKMAGTFEVDMTKYKEVKLDPWASETIPADVKQQLLQNIEVCRDAVVFFTACGSASGYGGHTGGAYDTVSALCLPGSVVSLLARLFGEFTPMMLTGVSAQMPEVMLLRAFFNARSSPVRLPPSVCLVHRGTANHSCGRVVARSRVFFAAVLLCLLCAAARVLAPGGMRFECHAVVCALL
jgi:hypothetical protein